MTILMLFNNREKCTFEVGTQWSTFYLNLTFPFVLVVLVEVFFAYCMTSMLPSKWGYSFTIICVPLVTTISPLLCPSIGDPAGDGYSWERVSASVAVFGLWEAHSKSSHQGAKVQGDWERPCVYSQWSVYFQTAQSQNTDRWAKFVCDTYRHYRESSGQLLFTTELLYFWFKGFFFENLKHHFANFYTLS